MTRAIEIAEALADTMAALSKSGPLMEREFSEGVVRFLIALGDIHPDVWRDTVDALNHFDADPPRVLGMSN